MIPKIHALDLVNPSGSLEAYIQAANQIPMLEADEERQLAERLQQDGDLQAAQRLVMSHLRFVIHVARGYSGYGLPQADLIQEGNVGLMKAVKRFDPSMNVRLVSFAVHWIRAEIHEFILRNWRIVKLATTKAQRKLFFNLRKSKKHLGWFSQAEVEAVARDLNVTPEVVLEMEKRMSGQDTPFDGYADANDDDDYTPTPTTVTNHRWCWSGKVVKNITMTSWLRRWNLWMREAATFCNSAGCPRKNQPCTIWRHSTMYPQNVYVSWNKTP